VISPLDRARLLDAEMQLQRAWLELNLRELSAAARNSSWSKLNPFKLGMMGLSFFKHRSLWLAAISLLMNLYRRRAHKEKS
jgi:hypothetical protein